MNDVKNPPSTLREAIDHAFHEASLTRISSDQKEVFVTHLEDFVALEFSRLAYDHPRLEDLASVLKRRFTI